MRKFSVSGLVTFLILGFLTVVALSQDELRDPVCGMKLKASEAKFKSDYKGRTYYFCSEGCKAKFDREPEKCAVKETTKKEHHPSFLCCMLGKDVMKEVKIEKRETEKGIVVTMTSSNPEIVKRVQETIGKCKEGMMPEKHIKHMEHEEGCCLMRKKDVKSTVTNIEKGVKIEFSSENPEAMKKLKESCKGSSCCGKEHKH